MNGNGSEDFHANSMRRLDEMARVLRETSERWTRQHELVMAEHCR